MSQEDSNKVSSKTFNAMFVVIFFIAFFLYCIIVGMQLTLPLYADALGATTSVIGLLGGIYGVAALLPRPISGQLVDNENRVILLRLCICLLLAATTLIAFAKNTLMLFAGRFLFGFTWGICSSLCLTIASNTLPKDRMAFGIGVYGMGQTLAQCLAPVVALPISESIGYSSFFFCCCGLLVLCLLLSLLMKVDYTAPGEKTYKFSITNMLSRPALAPALVNFCNQSAKYSVSTFLVLYSNSIGVKGIAYFFTIQALVLLAAAPIISRLADKHGTVKVLIPCELLEFLAMTGIALSNNIIIFYAAAVLFGLGMAGEQPAIMSECTRNVPESERGRASNTFYLGTDFGMLVGCYAGGLIADSFGYRVMYSVIGLLPIIALFGYIYFKSSKRIRT